MKRFTCILIALTLLLLCGCGKGSAPDKTVVILDLAATPTPTAEAEAAPADTGKDWYGWWKMDHCKGDWSHMYGYYWDCCAVITDADGGLDLQIWDEDLSRDIGLAEAFLERSGGVLQCTDGRFLDRALGSADWKITESADACGRLISIEGEYQAVGKGGFHYLIYLRPWGSKWPGSADERPFYYESWYLPMIAADEAMPDVIGNKTPEGETA